MYTVNSHFRGIVISSMERLAFVDCCDPILDSPSREVTLEEIKSKNMQQFFDAMLTFARGEQGEEERHVLVGLAAPQVGRAIRVIAVDVRADGKGKVGELRLYVNPHIVEVSQETEEWYEGCFSTGVIKGIVRRPVRIAVRALDREGHAVFEPHTGYVVRIFLHEIDHLDGIRFPQRIDPSGHLHIVAAEEMYAYRNLEAWRTWEKNIPQKEWKKYLK